MAVAVLVMATGAFAGGMLGDRLFQRTRRGRLIISMIGVFAGAVMLFVTTNVPNEAVVLFGIALALTALFTLFSGPNVAATVHDITVPEVRSTALAIQYFIESLGGALAPLLVGTLAVQPGWSLTQAIQVGTVIPLVICGIFLVLAVIFVPRDIERLRGQMAERADESRALVGAAAQTRV
jgi:MFS family permease